MTELERVREEDERLAREREKIVRDGPKMKGAKLEARLERTWDRPRGILGWLATVDHKEIGRRYIITALLFLALGGVLALAMRVQLAQPDSALISPQRYNELFTMHGSTMMFLFAVPVMEGVAVYVIPLMLGTRSTAFPRLNAFSYFMYLFGGLMLWVAFVLNIAPDVGWFAYTPLSGPQFSPGKRADVWAQMITFTEVSALAAAVVLICTILKARAPGMTLARMPLFAWAMLVQAVMIVFAMPAVALASSMLISDRLVGTNFYNAAEHGDALLWQHLFWFFGHPEVYIIFLPATGFVSVMVETFCRRPVFGHAVVVLALVSTGILAFGLWVHHMFATGLPRVGYSFYTAASMTVSIPTALQIFCWLATMWHGRPRFHLPMLYVVRFIATFVFVGVAAAVGIFVVNGIVSLYRGLLAPANPWGAPGLEWATTSPPPVYNFAHVPVVESDTRLWDAGDELPVVTGLRVDHKEMVLTTVVAAVPDLREPIPEASLWPFISAVAIGIVFVTSIFSPWAIAFGIVPCAIALTAWFWPKELKREPEPVIT